ncbi:LysR family transcriptional regulator [Algihabitans albus]|uniref:helix-turn-helix domain-containing protein n=1 Tax=Algihabitans albus TaxID=2164067 RepID=UPI0035CFBBAE
MLSLTDYRSVIALYEERHFARAAQVLGVTQPALTSRLRRVEEQLNVRLFDRGRGESDPPPPAHPSPSWPAASSISPKKPSTRRAVPRRGSGRPCASV